MMAAQASPSDCPRCRELEQRLAALETQVVELQAKLAKATKNSSNSSKPPSSDIVQPPAALGKQTGQKRKRGAQPGHQKHEREPFSPDQLDETLQYSLEQYPNCGGPLERLEQPARVLQQVELVVKPTITEHQSLTCRCGRCQKDFVQPIPQPVRAAGLVDPQLTAFVAYLKGVCHCSFSTIRKFLRDVAGLSISRGQLRNVCGKVADRLESAWNELLEALPELKSVNVDETGHQENGKRLWTWCFRASLHHHAWY